MSDEIRCKIEYREDESRQSPGRLYGVLMPYETRAVDRPEVFKAAPCWRERFRRRLNANLGFEYVAVCTN